MFHEMATVSSHRWGHIEELLAQLTERVDILLRVTVLAHSDPKKARPQFGPSYHYPRPNEPEAPTIAPVRPGQLFQMMRGGD